MPPRMKAREIAQSYFGPFQDDDGSESEACFVAPEEPIDWVYRATHLVALDIGFPRDSIPAAADEQQQAALRRARCETAFTVLRFIPK